MGGKHGGKGARSRRAAKQAEESNLTSRKEGALAAREEVEMEPSMVDLAHSLSSRRKKGGGEQTVAAEAPTSKSQESAAADPGVVAVSLWSKSRRRAAGLEKGGGCAIREAFVAGGTGSSEVPRF